MGLNRDLGNIPEVVTVFNGNFGIGTNSASEKLDVNADSVFGLNTGARISVAGQSLGFNRKVSNGNVYLNAGHAYQFQHQMNTIDTLDNLSIQVYRPNASQVTSMALSVNGLGNIGIGTQTQDSQLTINGNSGFSQIRLRSNDINRGYVYVDGTQMSVGTSISIPLNFETGGTSKMSISALGAVTRPSQPFAMGGLTQNQAIPLNTFTVINFDTSQGFYPSNVGNAWNNSTRTFVAPVSGVYMVNVSLMTDSVGQVALFVNGDRKHAIPSYPFTGSNVWGGSAMIPLVAGQSLTLRGYGNAGVITQNVFHTYFSIYLL